VRYYACEALYNITKVHPAWPLVSVLSMLTLALVPLQVARSNVLLFFNEIFDGLCKVRSGVRTAAAWCSPLRGVACARARCTAVCGRGH
jgi:hypothetical protein